MASATAVGTPEAIEKKASLKRELTDARRNWVQAKKKNLIPSEIERTRREYQRVLALRAQEIAETRGAVAAEKFEFGETWLFGKIWREKHKTALLAAGALLAVGVVVPSLGVGIGATGYAVGTYLLSKVPVALYGMIYSLPAGALTQYYSYYLYAGRQAKREELDPKLLTEANFIKAKASAAKFIAQGGSYAEFQKTEDGRILRAMTKIGIFKTRTSITVGLMTQGIAMHELGNSVGGSMVAGLTGNAHGMDTLLTSKASIATMNNTFNAWGTYAANMVPVVMGTETALAGDFNPDGGKQITVVEHLGKDPVALADPAHNLSAAEVAFKEKTIEYAVGQMAKVGHWSPAVIKAVTMFFEDPHNHDLLLQAAAHPEKFAHMIPAGSGEVGVVTMNAGDVLQLKSMVYGHGVLDMVNLKPDSPIQLIKVNVPYVTPDGVEHFKTIYIPLTQGGGEGCFNFSEALNSDTPAPHEVMAPPATPLPPTCEDAHWYYQTGTLVADHGTTRVENMFALTYKGDEHGLEEYLKQVVKEGFIPSDYQHDVHCRVIWVAFTDCKTGETFYKCWNIDTQSFEENPLAVTEFKAPGRLGHGYTGNVRHDIHTRKEFFDLLNGTDTRAATNIRPHPAVEIIAADLKNADGTPGHDGIPDTAQITPETKGGVISHQLNLIWENIFGNGNVDANAEVITKLGSAPMPTEFVSAIEHGNMERAAQVLMDKFGLTHDQAYALAQWCEVYAGETPRSLMNGVKTSMTEGEGAEKVSKTFIKFFIDAIDQDAHKGMYPNLSPRQIDTKVEVE